MAAEGTPLVSKQAFLRIGGARAPGLELARARIVTGTICAIAVLALLRVETGGLMQFVDEESAGLAAGGGFQMAARPVTLLGKCVSGDCVDGMGVYAWDSGEVYSGPFKHRRMHGKNGHYTWHDVPNNTTYEYVGNFDHGEMPKGCLAGDCSGFPESSRGVYVWPNGEEYVGVSLGRLDAGTCSTRTPARARTPHSAVCCGSVPFLNPCVSGERERNERSCQGDGSPSLASLTSR